MHLGIVRCCRWQRWCCFQPGEFDDRVSCWRWLMLAIFSWNICVSYLPYYTFVPILSQAMEVYDVDEEDLNLLCIVYALVYVPGAFLTGPLVGFLGCRWTFNVATLLITLGCALRHGQRHSDLELFAVTDHCWFPTGVCASSMRVSFIAILFGQTLCACGHLLLVNSTSEMAAEWFPAHERPAAAMVSNLMNFIGGSLSFMLPPFFVTEVKESSDARSVSQQQIGNLMFFQFAVSALSLVLTLTLFRSASLGRRSRPTKQSVSFFQEVRGFLWSGDFWIVNVQFMLYVAVCHAFDAVEGSLLEHYDISPSLTSWTALAVSVTAILSTLVESWLITDASSYKAALVAANLFMCVSLVTAYVSLRYHCHQGFFVFAVGIMGLATPGWGCSCELGSEVCHPAREATVTSFLEAFSNLLGVVSILLAQTGINRGLGAGVLLIMALANFAGGVALVGLSGQLRRRDSEVHHCLAKDKHLAVVTDVELPRKH